MPIGIILKANELTKDVDIDDTEFVALTDHVKWKLWSGEKKLIKGLKNKGWNKFITTSGFFQLAFK